MEIFIRLTISNFLYIIILLILAGISISALTNTGLFGKAEEAKQKAENAQIEENETLENYVALIDEITVDKSLANKVQPGDYVAYTPDTASTDSILEELGTYSGSDANTTSTLKQESSLNWRVLDVVDGKVRLISEKPTTSKIALYSAAGYNNAVYLIDKACSTLYNNSVYAEKVQNLKIEDIQKYLTYDYTQYTNSLVDTGKYGGTKTYYTSSWKSYPNIFAKEKTGWIDGVQGTELGLSEQIAPIDGTKMIVEKSLKVTETSWIKSMEVADFTDSIYYNLFINNGSNYSSYWMSSRCVSATSSLPNFNVRIVNSAGWVEAYYLYSSTFKPKLAFRPVITLKSDVQIDTTDATKDGTTAENAYVLK